MAEKKRIYLSSPTMHGDEQKYINEAFDTNWVAPLGHNVTAFEEEMCNYTGASYASALSSGTAAVHLALKCMGIRPGDDVITSDLTFAATCNPITYEGANPVLVDSEPDTWNMDPKALRQALRKYPTPRAVVVAHLYGVPAKLDEIKSICDEHNIPLIEDAAESLGATYKGKMTGTIGCIGTYSFNGNKIITTSGGGMMVSDTQSYVKRATFLATQARDNARYYQHSQIGYNYRMSNIVAGIGRGQVPYIDEHMHIKRDIYMQYKDAFADIPYISLNPMNPDGVANCWLTCILLDKNSRLMPDDIIDALEAENIESRPIWKPMHLQPAYAERDFFTAQGIQKNTAREIGDNGFGWDYSVGGDIFRYGVCLPSDIKNTPEDMDRVIKTVRKCFGK